VVAKFGLAFLGMSPHHLTLLIIKHEAKVIMNQNMLESQGIVEVEGCYAYSL
jgi:hypothetical protein